MKQNKVTGKKLFCQMMVMIFVCLLSSMGANAQIVLHDATDVTQTKATLSADFPDLSAEHGFQYKYGTLPELDDFSRLALAELSDPVLLTTTGNPWSARTVKGWVESKSGLSAGQSSVMSTTVTFSEQTEISFEWSVDSEDGIGVLSFIVDGTIVKSISGLVEFTSFTYTASAGKHTLEWQYKKSGATNVGLDIGMVRNISLQNTTEGEWLQASTLENSIRLQDLYPNECYLFRPYYYSNNNVVYGAISSFRTGRISIEPTLVDENTQSKASLVTFITEGDTPLKAYYLVEPVYSDPDQKALLHKDSDPVATLSKTTEWQVIEGKMSCVSLLSSATLTVTFSLTDTATISFDWAVKGVNPIYSARISRMLCLVDNRQQASISATNNEQFTTDSFSIQLLAGTHTIVWKPSVGYGDSFAKVFNLKINNTNYDFSERAKKCQAEVVYNHAISCKLQDLKTDYRYMAKLVIEPDYESNLPKRWNPTPVGKLFFRTLNVFADTLPCSSLSQASATIRGKIDGGDATIIAAGLQYKDATGSRWTDYPKNTSDTLLFQTVKRLRSNTTYHYRSYVQAQDCDTVFSEIGTFTTLAVEALKPELVNRTQHTAQVQGKVIFGDASIYQRGLQFRIKGNDEWDTIEDGGSDSLFVVKNDKLKLNTAYETRSYIQPAGSEIIYSDILTFSTKDVELYVDSVTNVYQRSATLHGRVLPGDDSASDVVIKVYESSNRNKEVVQIPISTTSGNFAVDAGHLNPQTNYVFTAEATNSEELKVKSKKDETPYENNEFLKALLSPTSSKDVTIVSSTNWRANTDEDYLYCSYFVKNQQFPLSVRVTLAEATDISFDWMYYSPKYHSFYFTVDGKSVISHASDNTRRTVTETYHLGAGTHILSWYEYWGDENDADFRVANLYIPENSVTAYQPFTTTSYLNDNYSQHIKSVTNTIATLKYKQNPTNESNLKFNLTATVNNWNVEYLEAILPKEILDQYPKNPATPYRIISTKAVGEVEDSIVTFCFENLFPGVNYDCVVTTETSDGSSTQNVFSFYTKPYIVVYEGELWMGGGKVTDITQTSAKIENTFSRPLDHPITIAGYRYWPTDGGDTLTVSAQTTDSLMSVTLTNLLPNKQYGFTYYVTVEGITYYSSDFVSGSNWEGTIFTTLPVGLSIRTDKVTQTSATLAISTDSGTATISKLQCRLYDKILNVENGLLHIDGLNPDQTYTIFFEYEVGGEKYEYTYKVQTAPIAFSASIHDVWQTSCVLNVSLDYGDASFVEAGVRIESRNNYILNAEDRILSTFDSDTWLLTELTPGSSYTVEPYVVLGDKRYYYADRIEVKTKSLTMATLVPTNISNRSATMNGTIDCDGYSSEEFGFQWKQMEGWNSDPAFTKGVKNEDGSISVALVNGMLEPNTDYQYRTAVRYKGQIYYANNWETFRTESEFVYYPANVYTVFRTDRENNCLILCGYYIAGSETVTSQGYEYWSNQSSTRSYGVASAPANNVVTITTDESMQYSLDLATLANGNYSVRAFVVTSSGIKTYGETLTFGVQNGTSVIEEVAGQNISISTSGTAVTVHHAASLVCSIYSVNGTCVMQRKLMDNKEVFYLNRHNIYIVRLSNGMSYKIKL